MGSANSAVVNDACGRQRFALTSLWLSSHKCSSYRNACLATVRSQRKFAIHWWTFLLKQSSVKAHAEHLLTLITWHLSSQGLMTGFACMINSKFPQQGRFLAVYLESVAIQQHLCSVCLLYVQTALACRMVDMRSESGFTPLHFAVSASNATAGIKIIYSAFHITSLFNLASMYCLSFLVMSLCRIDKKYSCKCTQSCVRSAAWKQKHYVKQVCCDVKALYMRVSQAHHFSSSSASSVISTFPP